MAKSSSLVWTLKSTAKQFIRSSGPAASLVAAESALYVRRYCPQSDALFEKLSVEEHLILYSRIRGVCSRDREQLVCSMCSVMGLSEYRTKLAGALSGGNRRKLCVSIALIGDPSVVLLDEPSTGMDPVARR